MDLTSPEPRILKIVGENFLPYYVLAGDKPGTVVLPPEVHDVRKVCVSQLYWAIVNLQASLANMEGGDPVLAPYSEAALAELLRVQAERGDLPKIAQLQTEGKLPTPEELAGEAEGRDELAVEDPEEVFEEGPDEKKIQLPLWEPMEAPYDTEAFQLEPA